MGSVPRALRSNAGQRQARAARRWGDSPHTRSDNAGGGRRDRGDSRSAQPARAADSQHRLTSAGTAAAGVCVGSAGMSCTRRLVVDLICLVAKRSRTCEARTVSAGSTAGAGELRVRHPLDAPLSRQCAGIWRWWTVARDPRRRLRQPRLALLAGGGDGAVLRARPRSSCRGGADRPRPHSRGLADLAGERDRGAPGPGDPARRLRVE
jgi:hypothetical protein